MSILDGLGVAVRRRRVASRGNKKPKQVRFDPTIPKPLPKIDDKLIAGGGKTADGYDPSQREKAQAYVRMQLAALPLLWTPSPGVMNTEVLTNDQQKLEYNKAAQWANQFSKLAMAAYWLGVKGNVPSDMQELSDRIRELGKRIVIKGGYSKAGDVDVLAQQGGDSAGQFTSTASASPQEVFDYSDIAALNNTMRAMMAAGAQKGRQALANSTTTVMMDAMTASANARYYYKVFQTAMKAKAELARKSYKAAESTVSFFKAAFQGPALPQGTPSSIRYNPQRQFDPRSPSPFNPYDYKPSHDHSHWTAGLIEGGSIFAENVPAPDALPPDQNPSMYTPPPPPPKLDWNTVAGLGSPSRGMSPDDGALLLAGGIAFLAFLAMRK